MRTGKWTFLLSTLQATDHLDIGRSGPYTWNERKLLLIGPSDGWSKILRQTSSTDPWRGQAWVGVS